MWTLLWRLVFFVCYLLFSICAILGSRSATYFYGRRGYFLVHREGKS